MRPYISRHRHQRPAERAGKRNAPFRAGRAERESERDLHRHVTPTTITPAKFDWVFGDGSTRTTDWQRDDQGLHECRHQESESDGDRH
jgi:hypothetical protein